MKQKYMMWKKTDKEDGEQNTENVAENLTPKSIVSSELNLFFHALMFYSRIPVGKINYSEERLAQSLRYFPLVGIIVGSIGAGIFVLANIVFPHSLSVIFALVAMIATTGALHEDGVADFFDGFGGGYTKERILAIMKDSHIGAYGVIALVLLFLFKFSLLISIVSQKLPVVLIAAHASSRLIAIILMKLSTYARTENSKSSHSRRPLSVVTLLVAFIFGILPFLFIPWQVTVVVLVVYAILLWSIKTYVERKIGGFTGDILGALQQFGELAFFAVYIAVTAF